MLIFDADDTLWENNVIFERIIDEFLEWMVRPGLDRAQARAVLDGIEAANVLTHGYGGKVFLRSLGECLVELRGRAATAAESARISGWAAAFDHSRVELIPGVEQTLAELAGRHEMLMLTKGEAEEQRRKVAASGLTGHFRDVHIVAEKDVATYEELKRAYRLVPEATWMIGNSPKSDILPARSAGLNAVFIPHDRTWALEHGDIDPADEKVLQLASFGELLQHF
ncbi:HAD family hydrolase [Streptomyces pinistramenti]|uniref:HAD family hydrolase n=1 Tax=Streptomyces pinistramenti TaxID=2884812 RepID=UPI001D073C57|nr:HAD family hydrolase [Streptomyces pinistramenti]MCB5909935.1 HAD family hydrolase [Streptomyces pinistramenti]